MSTSIFAFNSRGVSGYAGLEHLAWQQAVGLAKRGHQVAIICPEGSQVPGCTVFPVPLRCDEATQWDKTWPLYLQFNEGGAVVDHSWQKYSYLLKMEGRLTAPVLSWLHAPCNTMMSSIPPVENPCFVCISEDQKNHFEALFSPAKAKVCHNGVDLDAYKPVGLPRTDRFLFLARFSSIKGPDLAIKACTDAGMPLDLIGDTQITNEPELVRECLTMADGERIKVHGNKGRGECVWHFSQAKCLLHPNKRFREPFGLAPVEAMACGTPVIAWRFGAMPETVRHGETGWLVSSEAELLDAVKSCDVTSVMRKRCREWVAANFGLDRMVNTVESLCREAIEGGGW